MRRRIHACMSNEEEDTCMRTSMQMEYARAESDK
jgi:hypothetical protein